MSPTAAGALLGLCAGAAALAVVHRLAPEIALSPIVMVGSRVGASGTAAFAIAYGGAATLGALVGAMFASVTKYLRRWLPLLVWSEIFFVSLVVLLLAVWRTYGTGLAGAHVPAIVAATVAYAMIVSLALPLRIKR